MRFYTLQALQEKANKSKRAVCAWTPLVNGAPVIKEQDPHKWVHDSSAKVSEYQQGMFKHAAKIVLRPEK